MYIKKLFLGVVLLLGPWVNFLDTALYLQIRRECLKTLGSPSLDLYCLGNLMVVFNHPEGPEEFRDIKARLQGEDGVWAKLDNVWTKWSHLGPVGRITRLGLSFEASPVDQPGDEHRRTIHVCKEDPCRTPDPPGRDLLRTYELAFTGQIPGDQVVNENAQPVGVGNRWVTYYAVGGAILTFAILTRTARFLSRFKGSFEKIVRK